MYQVNHYDNVLAAPSTATVCHESALSMHACVRACVRDRVCARSCVYGEGRRWRGDCGEAYVHAYIYVFIAYVA